MLKNARGKVIRWTASKIEGEGEENKNNDNNKK